MSKRDRPTVWETASRQRMRCRQIRILSRWLPPLSPTPQVAASVVMPAAMRQGEPFDASGSSAKANCDVGRQAARSDASGTSSIQRHDRTGCRAGRNCSSIIPGQERQDRNRNGAGKRPGSGRRRQRPGPPAVASGGVSRSVGVAGDSQVRTINALMHQTICHPERSAKPASRASRGVEGPY